jgi:hypothetical protein
MATTIIQPLSPAAAQAFAVSAPQTQLNLQEMLSNFVLTFQPIGRNRVPNHTLYEQDFYAWTQTTANLIRAGQWYDIDRDALAEEIESLGKSEQHELSNRLSPLLEHLLKLAIAALRFPHALSRAERGWRATVKTQRLHIAHVLRDNPSLRPTVPRALADAYEVARVQAAVALDIEEVTIPETCPWTPEQVLNADFWPGATP